MKNLLTNRRRAIVGILLVGFFVVGTSNAWAEDFGNWDGVMCGDRGEMCNWRGSVGTTLLYSSSTRDSYYHNDYYSNLNNYPMNDHVQNYDNRFSTIKVRSYQEYNYITGSTCLNPGYAVGPYDTSGAGDGLSSFKSC